MPSVKLGREGVAFVQVVEEPVRFAPGVPNPSVELTKFPLHKELGAVGRAGAEDEVVVGVGADVLVRACVFCVFHQVVQVLVVQLDGAFPFPIAAQIDEVTCIHLPAALWRDEV